MSMGLSGKLTVMHLSKMTIKYEILCKYPLSRFDRNHSGDFRKSNDITDRPVIRDIIQSSLATIDLNSSQNLNK